MIQVMQQPRWIVLEYIVLIACHVKWAWDFLLLQSFFQPRGLTQFPDDVDDDDDVNVTHNTETNRDSSVECAICLCRIESGDEVRELRCQHFYHRICLERWIGYGHMTCPICRNNLRSPRLAAELDLQAEVMVLDLWATKSRDYRCQWWLAGRYVLD